MSLASVVSICHSTGSLKNYFDNTHSSVVVVVVWLRCSSYTSGQPLIQTALALTLLTREHKTVTHNNATDTLSSYEWIFTIWQTIHHIIWHLVIHWCDKGAFNQQTERCWLCYFDMNCWPTSLNPNVIVFHLSLPLEWQRRREQDKHASLGFTRRPLALAALAHWSLAIAQPWRHRSACFIIHSLQWRIAAICHQL